MVRQSAAIAALPDSLVGTVRGAKQQRFQYIGHSAPV
jgi:hypothetical protein